MADSAKKPGFFGSIAKFFREVKSELKKVTWPTKQQTIKSTSIVLVFLLIIGLFVFGVDSLFTWLVTLVA